MESTPLLQDDRKQDESSKLGNLLKVNVVFLIYHLSVNIYNPTISQFVYKRFYDKVYGNITGSSTNVTSKCFLNKTDPDYILQEEAQQMASRFQTIVTSVSLSLAVISCMFLGAYSDFVGRKFIFVVSLTGEILRYLIDAAVMYWNLDINYMLVGEFCEGISGGYNGVMLASYAYTADNTPPKNSRTIGLAVVDFTTYFALAISQIGTGYFINYLGFLYPLLTATGLLFLSVFLVIIMLSETITTNGKKYPSPPTAIKNVFGFYFSKEFGTKRCLFCLALLAYFLTYFCHAGLFFVEYLFELNLPFCWSPELIGYYNMAGAVAKQVLGIPVIKLFHLCVSDAVIAIITATIQAGAHVLHGFAHTNIMLFSYNISAAVAFPLLPALRALLSRMSPPDLQGSLFASIVVVNVLSSGTGMAAFNEIYSITVEHVRGFVYFLCAGLHVIVVILSGVYLCRFNLLSSREKSVTVVINDRDWKPGPVNAPCEHKEDSKD